MEVKIIDDFLDQSTFENLESLIMGNEFPWYFNDAVVLKDEEGEEFQLIHIFYKDMSEGYQVVHSSSFEFLSPIVRKLKSKVLLRVKANLLTRTPDHVVHALHTDISEMAEYEHFYTSIFYMNTNNGFTKFAEGTTINSIANRMIIFPGSMRHQGTTCTDQQRRVVINFNFFI